VFKWVSAMLGGSQKRKRIVVTLSLEDQALYEWWASRSHLKLGKWAEDTLRAAIPAWGREMFAKGDARAKIIDAAYDKIDEESGELPMPVKPKDQQSPGLHPCFHLKTVSADTTFPGGNANAMGTCSHPKQVGRPCYWAPANARECEYFFNKRVKVR
jgi:hypothetical protein